jgi:hypothetical protein
MQIKVAAIRNPNHEKETAKSSQLRGNHRYGWLNSEIHENARQVTDFYGSGAIPVLRIRLVFSKYTPDPLFAQPPRPPPGKRHHGYENHIRQHIQKQGGESLSRPLKKAGGHYFGRDAGLEQAPSGMSEKGGRTMLSLFFGSSLFPVGNLRISIAIPDTKTRNESSLRSGWH